MRAEFQRGGLGRCQGGRQSADSQAAERLGVLSMRICFRVKVTAERD